MNLPIPMLRLTPQAAGELQQQYTKAIADLQELTRFRKEFNRQLTVLIGTEGLRKRHNDTKNALLLTDLIKEAA